MTDQNNLFESATDDGGESLTLATFAERGVEFTTWEGWLKLNQHEIALGEAFEGVDRERVKVVARDEQVSISAGRK